MTTQRYKVGVEEIEIFTYKSENDGAVCAGADTANCLYNYLNCLNKQTLNVIDLGANVGSTSIALGCLFRGKIKIYAVEPHPELYAILVENIKKHNLIDIVIPFNLAIGSTQLFIQSKLNPHNTGTSITSAFETDAVIKVDCIKLDDFLLKNNITHADILKIDVEGAEYDIFSEFTLWDIVTKYHIEFHDIPVSKQGEIRKFGFYDEMLGPVFGLRRHILSKLRLNYRTFQARMF